MFDMRLTPDDPFAGEATIPFIRTPKHLMIVVVGPGRHSCWMPTFGPTTRSVARQICRQDGSPAKSIHDFPS